MSLVKDMALRDVMTGKLTCFIYGSVAQWNKLHKHGTWTLGYSLSGYKAVPRLRL